MPCILAIIQQPTKMHGELKCNSNHCLAAQIAAWCCFFFLFLLFAIWMCTHCVCVCARFLFSKIPSKLKIEFHVFFFACHYAGDAASSLSFVIGWVTMDGYYVRVMCHRMGSNDRIWWSIFSDWWRRPTLKWNEYKCMPIYKLPNSSITQTILHLYTSIGEKIPSGMIEKILFHFFFFFFWFKTNNRKRENKHIWILILKLIELSIKKVIFFSFNFKIENTGNIYNSMGTS